MRPLNRAEHAAGDEPFANYAQAKPALIDAIGGFCSYCEAHQGEGLDVEHVHAIDNDGPRLRWDNFLLSCSVCNSLKGTKNAGRDGYCWPDRDNTGRAFRVDATGRISITPQLEPAERSLAQATASLLNLLSFPGSNPPPSRADRRVEQRRKMWKKAIAMRQMLASQDSDLARHFLSEAAAANGFWTVWMTVFQDDPDLRRRLIEAFPGTAGECFDATTAFVKRPGGLL